MTSIWLFRSLPESDRVELAKLMPIGEHSGNSRTNAHINHLVVDIGHMIPCSHDGVEGLDPHGIDVAVEDDPLGTVGGEVGLVSHDGGEEAVFPLPRRRVDDAVELVVGHGLRVEVVEHGLLLQVLVSAEQGLPHLALSRSRISDCKRECRGKSKCFFSLFGPP